MMAAGKLPLNPVGLSLSASRESSVAPPPTLLVSNYYSICMPTAQVLHGPKNSSLSFEGVEKKRGRGKRPLQILSSFFFFFFN
jgi:hypothetical protein